MPPSSASTWTASGASVERPTARQSRRGRRNHGARPPSPPSPPLSTGSEDQLADVVARSALSALHDGHLWRRQQPLVIIPTTYSNLNDGPTPGTVVGIVLGSVFGFLLLLWLIYTCINMGDRVSYAEEEVVVAHDRRGSRSSRNSRSTPPRPRSRSPIRTESRVEERVIVEERRSARSPDDEIVEVIEEDEPPPRTRPGRNRPHSGYRSVDPDRYGGGNLPMEEVYPKRSSRRDRV